jgi:tRNA dimethylallyltransferase
VSKPLFVIVGPTCTGKTALAVAVARALAPAEMINADSRQVRRGLRIGTCAPGPDELRGVPCNLLDLCDPGESFSVADWLTAARRCLDRLDRSRVRAIVTGGTGLYVTALVDGFDLAGVPPDPARRAQRSEMAASAGGIDVLADELRSRDPEGAATIDQRNPRRVIRALEILDARGGSVRTAERQALPREAVMIGLDVARPVHALWMERRILSMFERGGIQGEVRSMLDHGLDRTAIAGCGIGYAEAFDLLDGHLDQHGAVQAALRRTLRYAKAQRTWFRRDPRVEWFRPDLLTFEALVEGVTGAATTTGR